MNNYTNPKINLIRDTCCCGATKKLPCLCMIKGTPCSYVYPLCPCYKLLRVQMRKDSNNDNGYIHEFCIKKK